MATVFDVHMYFSGTVKRPVDEYIIQLGGYRLLTFAYAKEVTGFLNLAHELGASCNIIIDSGAFTAWSVGKEIQLENLIEHNKMLLKTYPQNNYLFIGLDKIPGDRGRTPTEADIAHAMDVSYNNYLTMQQEFRGNYVLPVYHSGEDIRLRNAYLSLTDYVCFSMDQSMTESSRRNWARRMFVPGFKFHGLAATGNNMVSHIPWLSVDSSSWVTVGSMGNILWPRGNGFISLPVSDSSPLRHEAGKHLHTLTAAERAHAEQYIASKGFDVAKLPNSYIDRHKWNVAMWMDPPWRRVSAPVEDLFSC